MIFAIGVYEVITDNEDAKKLEDKPLSDDSQSIKTKVKKLQYAQQYHSDFFEVDQLKNAESILNETDLILALKPGLDNFKKMKKPNVEFIFFYKPISSPVIVAMVTKSDLPKDQRDFLFKNIEHILVRPDIVKKTLDDIIKNPNGFIGRDIHVENVHEQIQARKDEAIDNLSALVDRGEKLESLFDHSIRVEGSSQKFDESSTALGRRCCGYG